eukprot:m.196734 g.196734  ORF g.196734 m.196734 type:complete len:74 (+) comp15257_c0_seq3:2266-2487(+)
MPARVGVVWLGARIEQGLVSWNSLSAARATWTSFRKRHTNSNLEYHSVLTLCATTTLQKRPSRPPALQHSNTR